MKLTRFGKMWLNEDGFIELSGFEFEAETRREKVEGPTEETVIPEVIRFISRTCRVSVIEPPFDRQSELVVLHALRRARTDSKQIKPQGLISRIKMALTIVLSREPTK